MEDDDACEDEHAEDNANSNIRETRGGRQANGGSRGVTIMLQ